MVEKKVKRVIVGGGVSCHGIDVVDEARRSKRAGTKDEKILELEIEEGILIGREGL